MQEHEFTPAVEPENKHPKSQANDRHRRHQGHNPVQIAQDVVFGVFERMPEIFAAATVSAAARNLETRPTTFPQTSQPRAKSDNEPFAQIKRLEQHALYPFQRRADGFDHVDFHQMSCYRLNRVHRCQTLFQFRQAEKYILEWKL